MREIEITTHGNFQVATAESETGFTSWAKMGLIQSDCPITEPGEYVWFNFGKTREEAKHNILDELGITP